MHIVCFYPTKRSERQHEVCNFEKIMIILLGMCHWSVPMKYFQYTNIYSHHSIHIEFGVQNCLLHILNKTGSIPICPFLYEHSHFMASLNRHLIISTILFVYFQKWNVPGHNFTSSFAYWAYFCGIHIYSSLAKYVHVSF